jgi:hypothetical protein
MHGRGATMLVRAAVAATGALAVVASGMTGVTGAGAAVPLVQLVSPNAVNWTPNVSPGSSSCNSQWFGSSSSLDCLSTVYSEAVVNGEVVVAGAFTQACQPGPSSNGYCKSGTVVTRNDIFAYQPGTGVIDPDFAPVLDKGPVFSVIAGPPGTNSVYIGGQFTSVNGTSSRGLAQISVTPGNSSTDGKLVSTFKGHVSNYVDALALNGNALYVGGQFTSAGSTAETAVARLNATTGAVDPAFTITLTNPENNAALKVEAMALSPDGTHLAIGGTALTANGQSRPRLAVIDTGGALGATAALADFTAPILSNNCSAEHDYVRAIDFSPDGSFFVIGTTGFRSSPLNAPNVCDAVARFSLDSAGTATTGTADNVNPAWINFSGGDSFYSVAVTGGVVYAGGHNRWVNNTCGVDSLCAPNAVLANGMAALDTGTGLALPWWQPQTNRAHGIMFLASFPAGTFTGSLGGLLLGGAATTVNGNHRGENALFPLTSSSATTPGGPIPSGLFSSDGGSNSTGTPMCVSENSTASPAQVQISNCLYNAGTLYDPAQNWGVPAAGSSGAITINGLCMDATGGGNTSGAVVVADTCGGAASQTWAQGPGNTLVNRAAGLCLTDPNSSTTPGTQLQVATCASGAASQVWPLPAAQAPPAPPATGPVNSPLKPSTGNPLCMNDAGSKTTAGNPVVIYTCNGATNENWAIENDGTVRFLGNCLDTAGGGTASGTTVVLDPCNGAASQKWQWRGPGSYALANQASGLCLTDPGSNTSNGTQLQISACNGGSNEMWRLPAV